MPTAPFNTKCREFGCQNSRTSRSPYCSQHGGGITDRDRANSKLYSQGAWDKIRKGQLSRQPLCVGCLARGKVVQASHVDHVFPHRRNPERFKRNLFQSLCPSCHTLKTQMEKVGTYIYFKGDSMVEYSEQDYEAAMRGMT